MAKMILRYSKRNFWVLDKYTLRRYFAGNLSSIITTAILWRDIVFCASDSFIHVFERGRLITCLEGHSSKVECLLIVGNYLFSTSKNILFVWSIDPNSRSLDETAITDQDTSHRYSISKLYSKVLPQYLTVTSMIHPVKQKNSLLFASPKELAIWDVSESGKSISKFSQQLIRSWPDSPITSLAHSPYPNIIALGFQNAHILVLDISAKRVLASFRHPTETVVTSLSFRSDRTSDIAFQLSGTRSSNPHSENHGSGNNIPPLILISAASSGFLYCWELPIDLENLKHFTSIDSILPFHTVENAHQRSIHTLEFYYQEPILYSAGRDNTIKLWIFDNDDGTPRLWKQRSGHIDPPSLLSIYSGVPGDLGTHAVLSGGGKDKSLFRNSFVQDHQTMELSQGHYLKSTKANHNQNTTCLDDRKLPPITCISSSSLRRRDWSSILTVHTGMNIAFTWDFDNKTISKTPLSVPLPRTSTYTTVQERIGAQFWEQIENEWLSNAPPKPGPVLGYFDKKHHPSASKKSQQGSNPLTPPAAGSTLCCCVVSHCGNFGFVGSVNGRIDKFSMQTGEHMGVCKITVSDLQHYHSGPISFLGCDRLNRYLVSGSSSGVLKTWNMTTMELQDSISVGNTIIRGHMDRFAAIQVSSTEIQIWDISHLSQIRMISVSRVNPELYHYPNASLQQFYAQSFNIAKSKPSVSAADLPNANGSFGSNGSPPTLEINSFDFTPNSKNLVIATTCGVFVWDIISGFYLSTLFSLPPEAATCVRVVDSWVISTHVSSLLVHRHKISLFNPTSRSNIPGLNSSDDDSSEFNQWLEIGTLAEKSAWKPTQTSPITISSQDSHNQIVFSNAPSIPWSNLVNIDSLKQKRIDPKTIENEHSKDRLPFFLDLLSTEGDLSSGLDGFGTSAKYRKTVTDLFLPRQEYSKLLKPNTESDESIPSFGGDDSFTEGLPESHAIEAKTIPDAEKEDMPLYPKISQLSMEDAESPSFVLGDCAFLSSLDSGADFEDVLSILLSLSPNQVNYEFVSLSLLENDNDSLFALISKFLTFITVSIQKGSHYNVIQAVLNRFLYVHMETFVKNTEIFRTQLSVLLENHSDTWSRLEKDLLFGLYSTRLGNRTIG